MLALLAAALVVVVGIFAFKVAIFLHSTLNVGNPIAALNPPAGSVAWKIEHGQTVRLLMLGYGGAENDAPYLTDTMMILEIDPATNTAVEASIPRDLYATYTLKGQTIVNKINTAFSNGMYELPSSNQDRGGQEAMQVVSEVTGVSLDGYVGVDFAAFRDIVNALGGITVCLSTPLDDDQYPNYSDGYVKGGIHFKAGCQQVNGEQALEIARSRHATEAAQASDFARSQRQEMIIEAIKKKATSVDAIANAPSLMDAVSKDMSTNLTLTDLKAIYDWSQHVDASTAVRTVSIDTSNFLDVCGNYYLCPNTESGFTFSQNFTELHHYFSSILVPPAVLDARVPVQVLNGSVSLDSMGQQVTSALQMEGFATAAPVRVNPVQGTTVYNNGGSKAAPTAQWMASYFGARVVSGPPPGVSGTPAGAVVVELGHDFSLQWVGANT